MRLKVQEENRTGTAHALTAKISLKKNQLENRVEATGLGVAHL